MRDADIVALIKHNIEKADDAVIQAEALLKIQQNFGVVNRAYYAIFYSALAVLLTKGFGSSKRAGVLSLFDREFVKTKEVDTKWSKVFHDAFDLRSKGDYARLTKINKNQAESIIQAAGDFVSWTKKWLQEKGWE
jgi:uncharacterized protein (UPF0332 family)